MTAYVDANNVVHVPIRGQRDFFEMTWDSMAPLEVPPHRIASLRMIRDDIVIPTMENIDRADNIVLYVSLNNLIFRS